MCLARGQPLAAVRSMFVIARATQAKGAKAGKAGHKGLPSRAQAAEGAGLHVHLVMGNDKFLVGFKLPQQAVGRVFPRSSGCCGRQEIAENYATPNTRCWLPAHGQQKDRTGRACPRV